MKKISVLLIACILVAVLAACGDGGTTEPNNTSDQSSNVTESSSNIEESSSVSNTVDPVVDEYSHYQKIAKHNIYVNYKNGRNDKAGVNCHRFYGTGKDIAIFIYGDSVYEGALEGVFNQLNNGTIPIKSIGYTDAKFDISGEYPIGLTTSENMTINSIDCIQFMGSVTDDNGRVCFSYGYTFVVDDTPCMLVGFVFTAEQKSDEIESLKAEIDAMMKTVRTER